MLQSMGRYLALGLMALAPPGWDAPACANLPPGLAHRPRPHHDGQPNLYLCLASAIQRTTLGCSTMIIGTLPVVMPSSPTLYSQRDGKLASSRSGPALISIALGLVCVNVAELGHDCW